MSQNYNIVQCGNPECDPTLRKISKITTTKNSMQHFKS